MIKSYIITIASLVIISSIFEALMPDNQFKKHINLVIGLAILFAISKPMINLTDFSFDTNYFNDAQVTESSADIYGSMEKEMCNMADKKFEDTLSESVSDSIKNEFFIVCNVKANVKNGLVENITISGQKNNNIETYIKNTYGLNCIFTGE